jgi:hypothetical protein
VVQKRLARLRRGLRGRAEVRATSAKWAWVEFVLAQGAEAEGLAALEAVEAGGSFADYRRVFEGLGYTTRGPQLPRLPAPSQAPAVQSTVSRHGRRPGAGRELPLVG